MKLTSLAIFMVILLTGRAAAADFVPVPVGTGFPAFRLPAAAPGGHIVYSRILPGKAVAAGLQADLLISKLFVMNPDGTGAQPFLATPDLSQFKEARWSPAYDRLAFTSDFLNSRSACMTDIFEARADGLVRRVTGQDIVGPAPAGYGSVRGRVDPNSSDGSIAGRYGSEINITAQGANGAIVHPGLQNNDFIIPQVAAGDAIWIKVWASSQVGTLKLVTVRPGETTDAGVIKLNEGVFTASKGSLSTDGRFLVGMGGISQITMTQGGLNTAIGQTAEAFQPGLQKTQEGSESICIYDRLTGALVGSVDNGKLAYETARDPALSPDGTWIACAWGKATQENLSLLSLESVMAGRPSPQVLVPGQMLMFQPGAPMVGCGTPAWSPDGRWIVFTRTVVLSGGICSGGIWVVSPSGSGLREIASLGIGRICCQPCFSPDGKKVAFTALTGKFGPIKIEQLIGQQFSLDLFTVDLQTGRIEQITRDGASCEPAWGR